MNDPLSTSPKSGHGLAGRLREELRLYAIVSAYLYICFGALLLYKASLLQDAGLHHLPVGVAAIKALVIGKFLLIGDAIRKAAQRQAQSLLVRVVTRVLWLLVILILLTMAEEMVLGAWHGQSIADIRADFHARSILESVAEVLLMLLILTPLVAVTELNQVLGPGKLNALLTQSQPTNGDTRVDGSQTGGESR